MILDFKSCFYYLFSAHGPSVTWINNPTKEHVRDRFQYFAVKGMCRMASSGSKFGDGQKEKLRR